MLAPEDGVFVDGNPFGGTIVAAAFMNAVLGEFQAILALQDVEVNESGGLPEDHQQVAELLAAYWLRVQTQETYPTAAASKSIIIDPDALLAGTWPFRIWIDGAWETPETPLGTAPNDQEPDDDSDAAESTFTDAEHGQRGGGDLHALATMTRAGFLSPVGYQTLTNLAETRPKPLSTDWFAVSAQETYPIAHALETLPGFVQVWFRESIAVPPRLTHSFFSPQQRFCGYSVSEANSETLTLITGDRVWAGYTLNGFQEFSTGEYSIQLLAH